MSFLGHVLACSMLSAQEITAAESDDLIEWNQDTNLKWKDYRFRTIRNPNIKGEMAISGIRISALGYINEGVPEFTVKALFVKSNSWTTDSTNVDLLQHEQLHFDIGELYAQKIRDKIQEMKAEGVTSTKRYRGAIKNLITVFKSYSGQYDRDTEFGTKADRQKDWQARIARLLGRK